MRILKIFFFVVYYTLFGCSTPNESVSFKTLQQLTQLRPHYIHYSENQIEYYRIGQGSPIILIPGYATDVSSWNKIFLAALSENHTLIILNNRHVGRSKTKDSHYTTQYLANDIHHLIQQLNLKKPAVIGISMGGMIAQQLAISYKKELSHLILINTAIAGHRAILPNEKVQLKLLNFTGYRLGFYLTAIDLFFPGTEKIKMFILLIKNRFQPQGFCETNIAPILDKQQNLIFAWFSDDKSADKIQHLMLPTLILNGEKDRVIPPINSLILEKSIPHAMLIRFKNGGHAMIYQYPIQLAKEIDDFIKENG